MKKDLSVALGVLSGLLSLGGTVPAAAQGPGVVINEIVAENRTGLRDEDGAASDWLELYNPGAQAVSLAGYSLTDQESEPAGWPLPAMVLPAGGYLVVFASNKDRRDPAAPLHTDFAMRKTGEYLALKWQGQVVSGFVPSFPPQEEDVSYGFAGDGDGPPVFMSRPTPGAANDASGARTGAVEASPSGRLFGGSLEVTLTAPEAGAVIRYTLDGTAPGPASPVYAGPLTLNGTTKLRAFAEAGGRKSAETVESWVRTAADLTGYLSPLPVMVIENFAGGTVPSKGFPSQDGSETYQKARQDGWWLIQGQGKTWEEEGVTTGRIGIRGRGSLSTTWAQKGYSVKTVDGEGGDRRVSPLGLPENEDWVLYYPDPTLGDLRDPTMLSNTFIYELSRRMGRYAPRFRFVELFLNEDGGDLRLADRRGVYVLLEKISRGGSRLDFSRLSADGRSGGALLSVDRMDPVPVGGFPAENGAERPQYFFTAGPDRIFQTSPNTAVHAGDDLPSYSRAFLNFAEPGGYAVSPGQRAALEGWFGGFETALYDEAGWRDAATGWRKWLVEEDWAQGYLLHNFVRHSDAMRLSLYPWLGDDRRLRLGPVWDVTPGGYFSQGGPAAERFYRSETLWLGRLFEDPDFLQQYIDEWCRWRRTGFSDAAMGALIDEQAAVITPEKAVAQGVTGVVDWENRLTAMKSWVKGRAAFFDEGFLPVPVLMPDGGIVSAGTAVEVQAGGEEVWVTLDGTDPRLPGGEVSPSARNPSGLVISADIKVTARSRNGADWSAPRVAVFSTEAVAASRGSLVISEIHYHPAEVTAAELEAGFPDRRAFEFLELHNVSGDKLSLHEVRLVLDAERYEPAWSGAEADQWTLAPGGRLVLVADRAAFVRRYGMAGPVGGVLRSRLENQGGQVRLETGGGTLLVSVVYGTRDLWPSAADGSGYSLTLKETGADPGQWISWRSSVAVGGSPGTGDEVRFPVGGTAEAWREFALGRDARAALTLQEPGARLEITVPAGVDEAGYRPEASTGAGPWTSEKWQGPVESRGKSGEVVLAWTYPGQPPWRLVRVRASRVPPPSDD